MHGDPPGPGDAGAEEALEEPRQPRRRRARTRTRRRRRREATAPPGKKQKQKAEEKASAAAAAAPPPPAAAAAAAVAAPAPAAGPGTESPMEGEKEEVAGMQAPQGVSPKEEPLPSPPWEEGSGDENALVIIHSQVEEEEEAAAASAFKCLVCGESFGQPLGLLRHQKQQHAGERTFVCAECGKGFGLKHNLIIHQRTHTGEKPFACEACGKRFSLKQNLLTHQRVHGEAWPFACPACGKGFREQHLLLAHQKGGCSTGAKEKQRGSPSRQRQQPRGRHRLESARGERLVPPRPLRAKAREKLDPNGTCWESEGGLGCKNGPASHPKTHPTERPRPSKEEGRRGLGQKEGPRSPNPRLRSEDASFQCLTSRKSFAQKAKLSSQWQSHRDQEMLS